MSAITPYILHPHVTLGKNPQLGAYVEIGIPAGTADKGTLIGDNAVIRSGTILYAGNCIGRNFTTGHQAFLREDNVIGDDVSIGTRVIIEGRVKIGHRVRIHSGTFIPELCVIEEDAWIGPMVCFTNARYPASRNSKEYLQGVHVEKGARIGAGTVILPGIRIGAGALIGAGSVVTKDVAPYTVIAGNPARAKGDIRDVRHKDNALAYVD